MTHRTPTDRSFGITVGLAFIAVAGLALWRGRSTTAAVLAAMGAVLLSAGLLAPAALRRPNRVWSRFAQTIGWINARILLTLFFFIVLTPVGAVLRLLRRNPLRPASTDTNWAPYPERYRNPDHYDRLF